MKTLFVLIFVLLNTTASFGQRRNDSCGTSFMPNSDNPDLRVTVDERDGTARFEEASNLGSDRLRYAGKTPDGSLVFRGNTESQSGVEIIYDRKTGMSTVWVDRDSPNGYNLGNNRARVIRRR